MPDRFKYTAAEAQRFTKHGVDLIVYGEDSPPANVVHVSVEKGHFQEFYDVESTFNYFVYDGHGTFVIDDKRVEVGPMDLVVIPPRTRIHYFGTMKMVLAVAPAFEAENERHVRFVSEDEDPR